eukprot:m.1029272 g.1029272  ORF g.1029272 m.1029272 type:complete len:381 (-) comp24115_c0_seq7:723-1865(-)
MHRKTLFVFTNPARYVWYIILHKKRSRYVWGLVNARHQSILYVLFSTCFCAVWVLYAVYKHIKSPHNSHSTQHARVDRAPNTCVFHRLIAKGTPSGVPMHFNVEDDVGSTQLSVALQQPVFRRKRKHAVIEVLFRSAEMLARKDVVRVILGLDLLGTLCLGLTTVLLGNRVGASKVRNVVDVHPCIASGKVVDFLTHASSVCLASFIVVLGDGRRHNRKGNFSPSRCQSGLLGNVVDSPAPLLQQQDAEWVFFEIKRGHLLGQIVNVGSVLGTLNQRRSPTLPVLPRGRWPWLSWGWGQKLLQGFVLHLQERQRSPRHGRIHKILAELVEVVKTCLVGISRNVHVKMGHHHCHARWREHCEVLALVSTILQSRERRPGLL